MGEQAILVVSFGTTHPETRTKTIDAIEQTIQDTFSDWRVYRAWTSKMVIRKLSERDGYEVDTVERAMERMAADGVRRLVVQPTFVSGGAEHERMKQAVLACGAPFEQIRFGAPLLADTADFAQTAAGVLRHFGTLPPDTALVLVGHGTALAADAAYVRLEQQFRSMGADHVFVGTLEAGREPAVWKQRRARFEKAVLAPFLIVAGEHAKRDLAGIPVKRGGAEAPAARDAEAKERASDTRPDSWQAVLEAAGFTVECRMEGLGEYAAIRDLFAAHVKKAMEE